METVLLRELSWDACHRMETVWLSWEVTGTCYGNCQGRIVEWKPSCYGNVSVVVLCGVNVGRFGGSVALQML